MLETHQRKEWFVRRLYTPNSVKVVFLKALTVNYERARDDGLLFILAMIIGKLPL